MVGVLIDLKLKLLRRTTSRRRAALQVAGLATGLSLVPVLAVSAATVDGSAGAGDFLAVTLMAWTVGWLAASASVAGGGDVLDARYFSVLPISSRRIAANLLATSFVGIAPAMSLIAFGLLLVYGVWLGPAAGVVAMPAFILQWLVAVLLCRALGAALSAAATSRTRAVLAALPWAVAISLFDGGQTWAVIAAVEQGDTTLSSYASVARALPAGWGLMAVESADEGKWPQATFAIAALIALSAALAALAIALTARRTAVAAGSISAHPGNGLARILDHILPPTPTGATARKEVLTWSRDVARIYSLSWGLFYALSYCGFQLLIGVDTLLPWVGVIAAIGVASTAAHLYSSDGTALWLTLMTPDAVRADVRGRQLAWLLVAIPVTVGLTLAGLTLGRDAYAWAWVLALLPAVLGGGAGLLIAVSTFVLLPMPDPRHRTGPTDTGNTAGIVWLMLGLLCIPVALPALVAGTGTLAGSAWLTWAGVPTGILTGVLFAWGLGHLAVRRLETRGPETLHKLRSGSRPTVGVESAPKPAPASS